MHAAQVLLYVIGVILLALAALPILVPVRASLALLGAASLALGFTLPTIVAGVVLR